MRRIHSDVLREIVNRAAKATPGPWLVVPQTIYSEKDPQEGRPSDRAHYPGTLICESLRQSDRDFISMLSPEMAMNICMRLIELERNVDDLRAEIDVIAKESGAAERLRKLLEEEIPF